MKGLYRTKDGSKVEVLDFDEANKIVRINSGWIGQPEYSTWEKESVEEVVKEQVPEEPEVLLPEEIIEKEVIPEPKKEAEVFKPKNKSNAARKK